MGDEVRIVEDNVEATEAWNGPLFDIWFEYRGILTQGVRGYGERAMALEPPGEGDRVLDIGCGLGDTTVRLAELVGQTGHAHGSDRQVHRDRLIEVVRRPCRADPDVRG